MPPGVKKNQEQFVRLGANNQPLYQHRERVPVASVNAGYTLLPAVPNYQYRIEEMSIVAIGANAATGTDVRIRGTQAATVVALLITLLAALTRSALNFPGAANNSVLADGASFAECDVNTGIDIITNGAGMTGVTNFDVTISYTLVPTRQGA